MNRINVILPPDLYAEFSKRCNAADVPMSRFIKAVIEDEMARPAIKDGAYRTLASEQKIKSVIRLNGLKARDEDVRRMARANKTLREIASVTGMSISGVSKLLKRMGFESRV